MAQDHEKKETKPDEEYHLMKDVTVQYVVNEEVLEQTGNMMSFSAGPFMEYTPLDTGETIHCIKDTNIVRIVLNKKVLNLSEYFHCLEDVRRSIDISKSMADMDLVMREKEIMSSSDSNKVFFQ